MSSSFGTRLRTQREQQQVSLAAIAAATKIKVTLLEGLESDEVSSWPKGIFGRAYLRDYARAIGLDPEPVVREFYEMHPDPIAPVPAQPTPEEEAIAAETPLRRFMAAMMPSLRTRSQKLDPTMTAIATASDVRPLYEADAVADDLAETPLASDAVLAARVDDAEVPFAEHVPAPSLDLLEAETVPRITAPLDIQPIVELSQHDAPDLMASESGRSQWLLSAAASLCTSLARVVDWRDVDAVLGDAAQVLDAVGLIVWSWDHRANVLRPSLAHGYPDAVLSRLPAVHADEDHALATAFRSADTRVVDSSANAHGAVVVPLIAPRGCIGVFALELRRGAERCEAVRALATILAAQLVSLVDCTPAAEAVSA